jgi:membrane dipeptidase
MTDSAHAAALHQHAVVIDGHSDLLMSIADGKARLGRLTPIPDPAHWTPPPEIVQAADGLMSPHSFYFGSAGHYSLPQLRAGGVTVQVFAIYLTDGQLAQALQRALDMVWWLHREIHDNPDFELVTRAADIQRLKAAGRIGGILSLEGLEPLGSEPRLLDLFYKLGLRMAGLTHNRRNAFADGMQFNTRTGGLSAAGRAIVQRLNELGIIIDLAHLNQAGFWDVLELSRQPVLLTHSSARQYFPDSPDPRRRYPPDDVTRSRERLEALARNGGVFGVIFFRQASLETIVADIDFLVERAGPDHVALGSDFYGAGDAPAGLPDIARLPALTEALARRGYADDVILKVLGGNYLRVFEQVWKP